MKSTRKPAAKPTGRKPAKNGSPSPAYNPHAEAPSLVVGVSKPEPVDDSPATIPLAPSMPPATAPAKGKGGPPIGSTNALKHGVKSFLTTGKLPNSYVKKQLGKLRRQLESAVVESHGELSLYHSALIQSCARHEARAELLNRYLSNEKNLSLSDRMNLLAQISAATDSRDKALKALGLDRTNDSDPWAGLLDAQPPAPATNGEGGTDA
jgi:hypothetical protein